MRPHKWGLLTALVGIIRGGFQPDARMLPPNFRSSLVLARSGDPSPPVWAKIIRKFNMMIASPDSVP
jgi:hypothetical protein